MSEFWLVLAEMAPYLLLGFLVAGLLKAFMPAGFVERHLGKNSWWSIVKASLLGIPLPLCSCGVIPVAAGLRRQGASRGATASFLLSTPQTGVDSIMITYALLGPVYAVYRPIAALFSGVFGGFLTEAVRDTSRYRDGQAEAGGSCSGSTAADRLATVWNFGFFTLPRDIGKSLFIGLVIAALIAVFIPEEFFKGSIGSGAWAYLAMMLVGIPLYVCATASVPIAAGLIAAGISPGAALVFLITGPATNAAAIATVWHVLGRRTTFAYMASVVITALVSGAVLDMLYTTVGRESLDAHLHHSGPGWFESACAIALLLVLANALIPRRKPALPSDMELAEGQEVRQLAVSGMT